MAFVGGEGVECGGDDVLLLLLPDDLAPRARISGQVSCGLDSDVGLSALVRLSSSVCCLRLFDPGICRCRCFGGAV